MSETFDFVVVGSGGGSLCAALVMRARGKSVVVLEKTDLVGGTTAMSGGVMWIPNNSFMKADGIEDSHERAAAYLDSVVGDCADAPGASRARRLAYIAEGPKMLDFLRDQGIKLRRIRDYPDYYDGAGSSAPGRTVIPELFDSNELGDWKAKLRPGILPLPAGIDEILQLPWMKKSWGAKKTLVKVLLRGLMAKLAGKQLIAAGAALQGQMLNAAVKAGVEVRVNAPVKQILTEGGRVTGVVAEKDGKDCRIEARSGVLINAGGFSRNQRMRDQYLPGTSVDWTNTAPGDTGEMIEEAARAGAAIAQMDAFIGCDMALPPGAKGLKPMVQGDVSKPHAIVVDQSGVRYMGESGSYTDFCRGMLERNKTAPAVPSWAVVDSQYVRKYMLVGTMAGSKKPQAWFDSGFLRQGATLDELARACRMNPAKLAASVARFNGFVGKGRDEDFHRGERTYDRWLGDPFGKPSQSLGTIEEGPFFAFQVYPGDVGTLGGLVTDAQARVLRPDGSVIPGLYATGTSAASVMGRKSPGAGVNVGPSLTWGYVAAKHAAGASNPAVTPSQSQIQTSSPIGAQRAS